MFVLNVLKRPLCEQDRCIINGNTGIAGEVTWVVERFCVKGDREDFCAIFIFNCQIKFEFNVFNLEKKSKNR